ncbi:hypothetical protein [Rhizobium laguerreae]|uniref:hypothetical protein n=1 Tax=Rhizobium laguerreae TaxID=1076926 RepID=UPI001441CFCE|nr:hypothetical protein [Rhizobium laguerreae]NKN09825.1 hypothetical protein [Rhizobium laguerreae]
MEAALARCTAAAENVNSIFQMIWPPFDGSYLTPVTSIGHSLDSSKLGVGYDLFGAVDMLAYLEVAIARKPICRGQK